MSVDRAESRPPQLTVESFVRKVLALVERDTERSVDLYRYKDLEPPRGPFDESWLIDCLHEGDLKAIRVKGLTLITGESLRRLIASGKVWTPRKRRKR